MSASDRSDDLGWKTAYVVWAIEGACPECEGAVTEIGLDDGSVTRECRSCPWSVWLRQASQGDRVRYSWRGTDRRGTGRTGVSVLTPRQLARRSSSGTAPAGES